MDLSVNGESDGVSCISVGLHSKFMTVYLNIFPVATLYHCSFESSWLLELKLLLAVPLAIWMKM